MTLRRLSWIGGGRGRSALGILFLTMMLAACGRPDATGEIVRFTIPAGSGFSAVTDTLATRELVRWPTIFRLFARYRGAERLVKPGVYEVERGIAWSDLLDKLVRGDVVQFTLVIPEGWTLAQIAERIAAATSTPADSLTQALLGEGASEAYGVPGPTLEGYLYPATYTFPLSTPPDAVVRTLTDRYRAVWTPEREARAAEAGLTPREVVTLASIVEKEARAWGERDTIAAVFLNRLRIGMPLQADPTVQYARGVHQSRLLYEHIDEVADHPYNTYRRRGLPPGPIASPSVGAIDAALHPAEVDFLYFVARPNGTHIFTRSLAEHNRARAEVARMRAQPSAP